MFAPGPEEPGWARVRRQTWQGDGAGREAELLGLVQLPASQEMGG